MRLRDVERLDSKTPKQDEGARLYADEIPEAHQDAFWTFTGPQGVTVRNGRWLIPVTAWLEYLDWLRGPGNSPRTVTEDSKYDWRRRRRLPI